MVLMVIPFFSLFLAPHAREEGRTLLEGIEAHSHHQAPTTTTTTTRYYTTGSDQTTTLKGGKERHLRATVEQQLHDALKTVKKHFNLKGLTAIVMNLFTVVGFLSHLITIIVFSIILNNQNSTDFLQTCGTICPQIITFVYFAGIVSTTVTSIYLTSARSHTTFVRRVVSSIILLFNGVSLLFYILASGDDLGYDTLFEWAARAVFGFTMPLSWYGCLPVIMSWR